MSLISSEKILIASRQIIIIFLQILSIGYVCAQNQPAPKKIDLKISVVDSFGNYVSAARITLFTAESVEVQQLSTDVWGDAKFKNLVSGQYRLLISAAGFDDTTNELTLNDKTKDLLIQLTVQGVREEVSISSSLVEKKIDPKNFSTNILTSEQIEQLPDDPDELEQTLRNLAGPGAVISVNGFKGGKLPPKNQIREIRFRINPFSADSHDPDNFGVDVFTKPGLDKWGGSVSFAFRDESLNARNAFSLNRPAEQTRRFGFDLSGALVPKRTSLSLSANYRDSYEAVTILAATENGIFQANALQPLKKLNSAARVEHAVSPHKYFLFEYQYNASKQKNLGVGGFDLFERARSESQTENVARGAFTGQVFERFYNELRIQAIWNNSDLTSLSNAQTFQVLNSFTSGGAQIKQKDRSLLTEIADNFDFGRENHAMRAGFLFHYESFKTFNEANTNGTFVFSSLEDFRKRKPVLYTQISGAARAIFSQNKFGVYWQDDWRLRKNLTLSYGLRYERQSIVADSSNFAPRLNLVWSPFKSSTTIIRAGSGIYYDWLPSSVYAQALRFNGTQQREIVINNPNYQNPLAGNSEGDFPSAKFQLAEKLNQPTIWKNLVFLVQQIAPKLKLNIFYQHNTAWQQFRGRNINLPPRSGEERPNPLFGNITQIESGARSSSELFNIGVGWMNFPRFAVNADYQLGRQINETESPLMLPVDSRELKSERGYALSDIRHRLSIFGTMRLWKDFRLGVLTLAQSGAPYNITTGFDDNFDGVINDRPPGFKRNAGRGNWNFTTNLRFSKSFGFGKSISSNTATAKPVVTSVNRSLESVPAFAPPNAGANKRFTAELYLQAINLFNTTRFSNFSGVQTSPFFQQPTSALPARKIETGIRFNF